jgi:hypothetical protein
VFGSLPRSPVQSCPPAQRRPASADSTMFANTATTTVTGRTTTSRRMLIA